MPCTTFSKPCFLYLVSFCFCRHHLVFPLFTNLAALTRFSISTAAWHWIQQIQRLLMPDLYYSSKLAPHSQWWGCNGPTFCSHFVPSQSSLLTCGQSFFNPTPPPSSFLVTSKHHHSGLYFSLSTLVNCTSYWVP
jgi:hypothetical protein